RLTLHQIHPQAVVSPLAEIGRDVTIGPFCVIEAGAVVGDGCRLASHAVVKEGTTLGRDNMVGEGAVLGGTPQHAKPPEKVGRVTVGAGNVIREYATIHRSMYEDGETRIGDHNLVMVGVHVGHDCQV